MPDTSPAPVVLAVAAHPDDLEFMFAGTLLHLRDRGWQVHCWNLCNGCCGTAVHDRDTIIALRLAEAQASAQLLGAVHHPPIADDLAISYTPAHLARVTAVVRAVQPALILTHFPQDYMEDHEATAKLVAMGAFTRGMRNFLSDPPQAPWGGVTRLYHALPHGLHDALSRPVQPDLVVDIAPVLARKSALLACHTTQRDWLDASQGMGSYLEEMAQMARTVGQHSGRCASAEGWRRHNALGYAPADYDPLPAALGALCHAVDRAPDPV